MIAEHRRLVDLLVGSGHLGQEWRGAFEAVPRHLFVPDLVWRQDGVAHVPVARRHDPAGWLSLVYSDAPVVTQLDDGAVPPGSPGPPGSLASSSSSMPTVVARMLRWCDLTPGMRVLEIGTGTGWNAGLLSARLGAERVISVEVDAAVAGRARAALGAAGLRPAVVTADGTGGYPPGAPYDRVLSTASVRAVPYPWVAQTGPGGVVVTPWETGLRGTGRLLRLRVGDGDASGRFVDYASFMRLRAQRVAVDWDGDGLAYSERLFTGWHPYAVNDPDASFAIGQRVGDCVSAFTCDEEEPYDGRLWFCDPVTGSHATVDVEPDADRFLVRQGGPRRLWDEVEAGYDWWVAAGRPGYTRFGVTVTPDRQWTWLDSPDRPVPDRPVTGQ